MKKIVLGLVYVLVLGFNVYCICNITEPLNSPPPLTMFTVVTVSAVASIVTYFLSALFFKNKGTKKKFALLSIANFMLLYIVVIVGVHFLNKTVSHFVSFAPAWVFIF